ncbi:MAG: hypothetical protein GC154_05740 [bacterium]|nr:hypothetical protein [bacterium]
MAETLTYDLITFLRVLYRRRKSIVAGTIAAAVLSAIAALVWPQTWRAEANIFVSPPKYKETFTLVSNPFDVLTYQSILQSDGLIDQVIRNLRWGHEATHTLVDTDTLNQLKAYHQDRALRMTPFQMIENTREDSLREWLVPADDAENPAYDAYLYVLTHIDDDDLRAMYDLDPDGLEDLSIFDLRKMLSANVSVVKETNLETIYSPVIRASAEYDTGESARMLTNVWLMLFQRRAEEIVKRDVERQIHFFRNLATERESELKTAETELKDLMNEAGVETQRAEAASTFVTLNGVAPIYTKEKKTKDEFDLEESDRPFMTEHRQDSDIVRFDVSDQFEDAVKPALSLARRQWMELKQLEEASTGPSSDLQAQLRKVEAKISSLEKQSGEMDHRMKTLLDSIRASETDIRLKTVEVERARTSVEVLEPFLAEANLLEQPEGVGRYADISYTPAIKPDKRIFPKRTFMTALGTMVGFILFCGLAFFRDIWAEVTRD